MYTAISGSSRTWSHASSDFYVEKVEFEDVMQGALRGLASGLDSDSAHLSAEDVLRLETGQPLPEGRLGVEVSSQYYLQIVAVRDGSPAARAGLLPGDYVRAIDDQTTRLVSAIEGERLLRGEPGSSVRLSLLRGNTSEPYDISLVRESARGTAVTTRLLSTDVGYIRVPSFDSGIADQIETAVSRAGNPRRHVADRGCPQHRRRLIRGRDRSVAVVRRVGYAVATCRTRRPTDHDRGHRRVRGH